MSNNLNIKLIAVAAIFGGSFVSAQLPRECFYVTELHGIESSSAGSNQLLSDLPTLMTKYKPGMRLASVVSHEEDMDAINKLAGLQVNLERADGLDPLELPTIGQRNESWSSQVFE